jgi:hypothetical protein
VKAMNKEGIGFISLTETFPHISKAKIRECVFVGPQVKQLFQNTDFRNKLNSAYRGAREVFKNVRRNFQGNNKSENYV